MISNAAKRTFKKGMRSILSARDLQNTPGDEKLQNIAAKYLPFLLLKVSIACIQYLRI